MRIIEQLRICINAALHHGEITISQAEELNKELDTLLSAVESINYTLS